MTEPSERDAEAGRLSWASSRLLDASALLKDGEIGEAHAIMRDVEKAIDRVWRAKLWRQRT